VDRDEVKFAIAVTGTVVLFIILIGLVIWMESKSARLMLLLFGSPFTAVPIVTAVGRSRSERVSAQSSDRSVSNRVLVAFATAFGLGTLSSFLLLDHPGLGAFCYLMAWAYGATAYARRGIDRPLGRRSE
jgi:hypothetical protein